MRPPVAVARPPAPEPLPRSEPARPAPTAAPAAAGALPLLLVDDSAVVRAKLRKLFDGHGHPLLIARDGLEALAMLRETRCALMITDLEMPNMDGLALIAALPSVPLAADLPVVAITGHDDMQSRLAALPGVVGVFRKPWVDAELFGRVQALLAQAVMPQA